MIRQLPLYKIPEKLETAGVLDDSILKDYNDSINNYNKKARETLNKFIEVKGELAGSNPFMLVHLANFGLLPTGARLAKRKDLETTISVDDNFLKGNYVDFGLVLRTANDPYKPNDLLAKRLATQLKEKGIDLNKGKLISLNALRLQEDKDSDYGLVFDLNEQTDEILDLDQFTWDYIKSDGLVRAVLDWGRGWFSSDEDLADSGGRGRVVVISDEGASQKILDKYLAKLQKARDDEIAQLQKKYAQAEAILKGK